MIFAQFHIHSYLESKHFWGLRMVPGWVALRGCTKGIVGKDLRKGVWGQVLGYRGCPSMFYNLKHYLIVLALQSLSKDFVNLKSNNSLFLKCPHNFCKCNFPSF